MPEFARLHGFLGEYRRRAITAIVVEWTFIAAGAAMAGAVLLLFLGAQILAWYWLLILFAGSLAPGLYGALRGFPSRYQLAQQVDRRLNLNDTLSTAYYFSGPNPPACGSVVFRELLCRQADGLCAKLSPKAVSPIRLPRSAYVTGLLTVAALGVLGVRYTVIGSLDLRPPLLPSFGDFTTALQVAGLRVPLKAQKQPRTPGGPFETAPEDLSDWGEGTTGGSAPKDSTRRDVGASTRTSSMLERLLDKVEDAVTRFTTQDIAGGPGAKDGMKGLNVNPGDRPGLGEQNSDSSGSNPQGNDASQQAASGASQDPGNRDSGRDGPGPGGNDHGDNEGDKSIKEAAQLNAAGKIAEQYLRRQARITGGIMVEVPGSMEQTLATPYTRIDANHAESGGPIHRNEVPLAYQQFVGRYYQQLRSPAAASGSSNK